MKTFENKQPIFSWYLNLYASILNYLIFNATFSSMCLCGCSLIVFTLNKLIGAIDVQAKINEGGYWSFQKEIQLVPTHVQRKRPPFLGSFHPRTEWYSLRQLYFLGKDQFNLWIPDCSPQNVLQNKDIPSQHPLHHWGSLPRHNQNWLEPHMDSWSTMQSPFIPPAKP